MSGMLVFFALAFVNPSSVLATSASQSGVATMALSTAVDASQSVVIGASSINATQSMTAIPASTSSVCVQVPGSPQCDKPTCCLGSSAAWSGVNSTATVAYTETTCPNNTATVTNKTRLCSELCVNKECDGAASLAVQLTTILMSFFVYWCLVEHQ